MWYIIPCLFGVLWLIGIPHFKGFIIINLLCLMVYSIISYYVPFIINLLILIACILFIKDYFNAINRLNNYIRYVMLTGKDSRFNLLKRKITLSDIMLGSYD